VNAAQIAALESIAHLPLMTMTEVPGLGVILVTRAHDNSYAEVVTVNEDGLRDRMTVRVSAPSNGSYPRDAEVGTSGTHLSPLAAVAYAALITYAVQAVLPTLTPEAR
jgi:hypothetical protein